MLTRPILFTLAALAAIAPLSVAQDESPYKSEKEQTGYSAGVHMGKFLENGADLIDIGALLSGLTDLLQGEDLAMDEQEMKDLFIKFQQAMLANVQKALSAEGKKFLAENAKKDGVVVLSSGLQYKVIRAGTGATPIATDTVSTNYRGTLVDGTEFDSSYKRGTPAEFPVRGVIAGWTEALQLMKVGGKWELYVPANLAYGAQARGPLIKANSALIFELELLDIVK